MTTKTMTCRKCSATTMRVETRKECHTCEWSTCSIWDEDDQCPNKTAACRGNDHGCDRFEIDHYADECDMGSNNGCGCWIVTCAMCQTVVEHSPMMEV
jgi:hypothetical protein